MDRSDIQVRTTAARRGKAFTLVELLVVVAVIAILAALLLSSLSGAKLRAQQIQCLNNLKQMALARQLYFDEYGCFDTRFGVQSYVSWTDRFRPYGVTPAVVLCPSTFGTNSHSPDMGNWLTGTADHPWYFPTNYFSGWRTAVNAGSYAMNQYLTLPAGIGDGWQFGNHIPAHPSETPAFADAIAPVGGPWGVAMPATNLYTGYYTLVLPGDPVSQDYRGMTTFTIARHGSRSASAAPRWVDISKPIPGMIQMALYDGHVEKARLENLWNYYWSQNWWIPNPRPGLPGFDR